MKILKSLSLSLVVLVSACGRILIGEDCECGFYTNAATNKMLHWPDGTKIKFEVHKNVPDEQLLALEAVGEQYNKLLQNTQIDINTSERAAPSYSEQNVDEVSGDGINGVYWVTGRWPWKKKEPNSDAMTVVSFSASRITEADIFFRARSFRDISGDLSRLGALQISVAPGFEIESASVTSQRIYTIGLHEFGHAIGRTHSHENGSLMFPSVGLGLVEEAFSDYDREIFSAVYELSGS